MRSAIVSLSTSRGRESVAFFLAATLLVSWLGCAGGLADLAAHFGPALLLVAVLAAGRYPGEAAIARLRGTVPARGRRPAAIHRAQRRTPQRVVAFRARLLAHHLAVRPPPAGGSAVA